MSYGSFSYGSASIGGGVVTIIVTEITITRPSRYTIQRQRTSPHFSRYRVRNQKELRLTSLTTTTPTTIRVLLNGVNRASDIVLQSLQVISSFKNQEAFFETRRGIVKLNDTIEIFDGSYLIFAGRVRYLQSLYREKEIFDEIMARGWETDVRDGFIQTNYVGWTAPTIINDALNLHPGGIAFFRSINVDVPGTFTIQRKGTKTDTFLDDFAQMTGAEWFITTERDFHFRRRPPKRTSIQITDHNRLVFLKDLEVKEDMSQLKNRIAVYHTEMAFVERLDHSSMTRFGWRFKVFRDLARINTIANAELLATELLAYHKDPHHKGNFKTKTKVFEAGQQIRFNLLSQGLDFISEVDIIKVTAITPTQFLYDVSFAPRKTEDIVDYILRK